MSTESSRHASCCDSPRWYEKRVWWVAIFCLTVGFLSRWLAILRPFSEAFWRYMRIIALPVGAGLLAGGLLDRFIPKEYISKLLARQKKRTIVYATILGLFASACSHGILALSMELHKKGASGPAVISFLLASPWANFPVTLLLVGLFGIKGLLIVLAALIVALNTGFMLQILDRKNWIEKNKYSVESDTSFSIASDIKKRLHDYQFSFSQAAVDLKAVFRGTIELSEMVLGWVLFGIVLASLAEAFIPVHIFKSYLGPSFLGLLTTLIFATVLEVCSEGTAPLAFEIYRQTKALGNSFVFLSAGVITDYTEIGLVWQNLGKRTAIWMILTGVPQVLILGYLFNRLF